MIFCPDIHVLEGPYLKNLDPLINEINIYDLFDIAPLTYIWRWKQVN